MRRRAWHVATLTGMLGCLGCGTDPGTRTGTSAGSGGGQAAGGQASGGGVGMVAGAAVGGQSGDAAMAGSSPGASGASGAGAAGSPAQASGTPMVYVGGVGNFPLRIYELDKQTGALTQRGGDAPGGRSPSYLALAPSGTHLYNVNEVDGDNAGVTAHRLTANGSLAPLNHQAGTDNTPQQACAGSCGFTHLAVDPSGKFVIAASYGGGSVSVFPIAQNGSLGPEKQLLDFGNQAAAHSVAFDATGKFVFVPALGLNAVKLLALGADGLLSANTPAEISSGAGTGPRHIAMHPNGKLAFVINENASSVTPFTVSADGKLGPGASVSSLPAGFSGESYGQHVEVSPDGRFVYASNVGHDSIAVLAVDQNSGALTHVQDQPSGGAWPRDFDVDPNGDVLVVANRDSDTLAVFAIADDGKLTLVGQPTTVPNEPTSVVIRYRQ